MKKKEKRIEFSSHFREKKIAKEKKNCANNRYDRRTRQ